MFVVIYQFDVLAEMEEEFLEAWAALTKLIYVHEGSLGSHLHRSEDKKNVFIAYAKWPSAEVYESSGNNLPPEAETWRAMMRNACSNISTLHTLRSTMDLTEERPYN